MAENTESDAEYIKSARNSIRCLLPISALCHFIEIKKTDLVSKSYSMKTFSPTRYFPAAAFLLILSGCSVTPAVDAVTLGVGGVSYIFTGKGVVDHTTSVATGQDCAWLRVTSGRSPCVPTDEDVAGDRLVFEYEGSPWVDAPAAVQGGDPVLVDSTIAGLVEPLGSAVRVESRSTAVAAVADEALPVGTTPVFEDAPVAAPDRATRLWLPVD